MVASVAPAGGHLAQADCAILFLGTAGTCSICPLRARPSSAESWVVCSELAPRGVCETSASLMRPTSMHDVTLTHGPPPGL